MADNMIFSNFANMKKIIITIITTIITLCSHAQIVQCEDTCQHVHGIDLSHYQGNVFWETVGDNSKMAYVYLKATEGGTNVDSKYKQNIDLAHRYGLKVGSYHSIEHASLNRLNLKTSWRNADLATKTCSP